MSEIARRANLILDDCWDGRLPVDLVAIARDLGIQVLREPAASKATLTRRTGGWTATLAGAEPLLVQRFALAHMLGHVVLGHADRQANVGLQVHEDVRASYFGSATGIERDANLFALRLLMPADELRRMVAWYNFDDLVSRFQVSEVAMQERLIQLGIVTRTPSASPRAPVHVPSQLSAR